MYCVEAEMINRKHPGAGPKPVAPKESEEAQSKKRKEAPTPDSEERPAKKHQTVSEPYFIFHDDAEIDEK